MEVDSNIYGDPHVVFCGHIRDRTFVPDRILRDHAHNLVASEATGVAASETRGHNAGIFPQFLLHREDSVRDVKLENAAWLLPDYGHDRNTLRMVVRYDMWRLFDIIHVQLNQMSSWSKLALKLIMLLLNLADSLTLIH